MAVAPPQSDDDAKSSAATRAVAAPKESGALEVLTPLLERLGHFGAAAQTPASPF